MRISSPSQMAQVTVDEILLVAFACKFTGKQ